MSFIHQQEGILLVNKPKGKTSFSLVAVLRKLLGIQKIGHAGTLDPFATGVMVMLIGKQFTRLSDKFLLNDKEYLGELILGTITDTYDCDGEILSQNPFVPERSDVEAAIQKFQGEIDQIPPMFSAKKIKGKKLYELAREGKTIEREPVRVHLQIQLLAYDYPKVIFQVKCSKGTYIRSLAHDIGMELGCGAYLTALERVRSGSFKLEDCIDGQQLFNAEKFSDNFLSSLSQRLIVTYS